MTRNVVSEFGCVMGLCAEKRVELLAAFLDAEAGREPAIADRLWDFLRGKMAEHVR